MCDGSLDGADGSTKLELAEDAALVGSGGRGASFDLTLGLVKSGGSGASPAALGFSVAFGAEVKSGGSGASVAGLLGLAVKSGGSGASVEAVGFELGNALANGGNGAASG